MITKRYISYRIKSEDTLKSLATRIGLDHYKLLRNFHNSHSSETQILKNDILIKGNVLYVPDIKDISELNKNYKKEHNAKQQNRISKLEFSKLSATYRVEIKKENFGSNKEGSKKIAYDIEISPVPSNIDSIILSIEKDNFSVNNRAPQTKMQQLAMQCAKSYYPLEVRVSEWGAVEEIVNMAAIRERWKQNKSKIKDAFTGIHVDTYLNNLDDKINNTNQLEIAIKNDLVIQTLFLPYKTLTDAVESSFPWHFSKHHIGFQINQEIECENENELLILQEGNVDDIRSYRDILNPEASQNNPFAMTLPKMEGYLKSLFVVDTNQGIIKKVEANYDINYTQNKRKNTNINIDLIKN